MSPARFRYLGVAALLASGAFVSAQTLVGADPANHLQRLRGARKMRVRRAGQSIMLARARTRLFTPEQSFDTSGDGVLNGAYFVRQILALTDQTTSAITRAVSLTGTMTFDGKGDYTFSGQELDTTNGNTVQPYSVTSGTYAVSSSGLVQIQNPVDNTDIDYGAVGGAGEIVASATEGSYDDILVAIPAGSGSGVAGSYHVGFIDYLGGDASDVRDGYYTLTSGGTGGFGTVMVNGAMANQGSTNTTQTISGVTYSFSGTNGTLTFPAVPNPSAALVSGAKTFAVSADGNILVGGSAGGFDLFVGMKSAASVSSSTLFGVYFNGALENDTSGSCGEPNCIDSFYGSIASNGQGAGTEHLRDAGYDFAAYDYTSDFGYTFLASGVYNDGTYEWMLGNNAEGLLQVGLGDYYTLIVSFEAKAYSGTGVFLNPDYIVNSASFAPITNSVAPGEYVTLAGTGLAANGSAISLPLPMTLGGAQAASDGNPCLFLYTSPTLLNVFLSNATPAYDFATFQVTNGSPSNQVTVYTASTAPGVYTATANGIGSASVFHLNNYTYVTLANPAAPGESLFFYANGLGATTPAVADGAAAPSSPLALVNDPNLSIDIYDSSGNYNLVSTLPPFFAGLAPELAGVYQINFTVPVGTAAGEGYLDVGTSDGYTSEAKIYIR